MKVEGGAHIGRGGPEQASGRGFVCLGFGDEDNHKILFNYLTSSFISLPRSIFFRLECIRSMRTLGIGGPSLP